jgi:hypothetical protein
VHPMRLDHHRSVLAGNELPAANASATRPRALAGAGGRASSARGLA